MRTWSCYDKIPDPPSPFPLLTSKNLLIIIGYETINIMHTSPDVGVLNVGASAFSYTSSV